LSITVDNYLLRNWLLPAKEFCTSSAISRNNLHMADVPIYVAIITAAAGIIGAAIPQAAVVIRDVRQAERDRRERSGAATREACVALLRAAGEVRTLTESIRGYRGAAPGMRERVEEVRRAAEATRVHAAEVSMQAPGTLAGPADQVAGAASDLADDVVRSTDLNQGVLIGDPDVTKLVERIAAFSREAVRYAGS
jgi:hypothetical protein